MINRYRNKVARQRRKQGADARQAEYDKLTVDQKIARLGTLTATKQRIKLLSAFKEPKKK